eukprot:m.24702 g.24702  ORF g.24702 m.24702 type:complete len:382 (+) comp8627_c0_seq3:13-1158(+)
MDAFGALKKLLEAEAETLEIALDQLCQPGDEDAFDDVDGPQIWSLMATVCESSPEILTNHSSALILTSLASVNIMLAPATANRLNDDLLLVIRALGKEPAQAAMPNMALPSYYHKPGKGASSSTITASSLLRLQNPELIPELDPTTTLNNSIACLLSKLPIHISNASAFWQKSYCEVLASVVQERPQRPSVEQYMYMLAAANCCKHVQSTLCQTVLESAVTRLALSPSTAPVAMAASSYLASMQSPSTQIDFVSVLNATDTGTPPTTAATKTQKASNTAATSTKMGTITTTVVDVDDLSESQPDSSAVLSQEAALPLVPEESVISQASSTVQTTQVTVTPAGPELTRESTATPIQSAGSHASIIDFSSPPVFQAHTETTLV